MKKEEQLEWFFEKSSMVSERQLTPWYLRILGYDKYRYRVKTEHNDFWIYAIV